MRRFRSLLTLVAGVALVSASAASGAQPLRLRIAVNDIYGRATACSCVKVAEREYDEFLALLRQRYAVDLEFAYFTEPYQLAKAMRTDRFDGALCKPWLLLRDPAGRKYVRAADLQSPTGDRQLWGDVVVLDGSPIRTLRDLAGRKVVFGEVDAYEKHHAALALFAQEKVSPAGPTRIERASCLEGIDLVLKHEADAAVISNYAQTADCAVDVLKPGELRTIARTARIPLTSLLLDERRVGAADIARISHALIELSKAGLPASMHGGGFLVAEPWQPDEAAASHR